MGHTTAASLFRQLLDDVDRATAAYGRAYASPNVEEMAGTCSAQLERLNQSQSKVFEAWIRADRLSSAGSPAQTVEAAKSWIQPYVELGLFQRLGSMFSTVSADSLVVISSGPARLRMFAAHRALLNAQPSAMLIKNLHIMLIRLAKHGSQQEGALLEAMQSRLLDPGLIKPAGNALRGMVSLASFTLSRGAPRALGIAPDDVETAAQEATSFCAQCAGAGAKYALFAIQRLLQTMGSSAPHVTPADPWCRHLEAFATSDLLPAVAAAVCGTPALDSTRDVSLYQIRLAARDAMQAVVYVQMALQSLQCCSGERAAALAQSLALLLSHPDVGRLQCASLERLLLHAGLQDAPGSVSGSSGPPEWWLMREEAATGRLCGIFPGNVPPLGPEYDSAERTAGWLEDDDCYAVAGSLGVWYRVIRVAAAQGEGSSAETAASAGGQRGSPAAGRQRLPPPPPPLHLAYCTVRTAEALVRLCRGQGMERAYAPRPEWQFAKSEVLMAFFDFSDAVDLVPPKVACECLPYWLEAAAWGLALAAEAEAAHVAGAAVVPPRSTLASMATEGGQTKSLLRLMKALGDLLGNSTCGLSKLSDSQRVDCAKRLQRAGLAASLDRVLRLTFAAQDRGTPASQQLFDVLVEVGELMLAKVMDLLGPSAAASPPQSSPSSSPRAAPQTKQPKGAGVFDLMCLLTTSAKRANTLAASLEAAISTATGPEAQSSNHRTLLVSAYTVLRVLLDTASTLSEGPILRAAAALPSTATTVAPGSQASAADLGPSGWDAADAQCRDEMHEAIAFAARAACALTTSLAVHAFLRRAQLEQTDLERALFTSVLDLTESALYRLLHWCAPTLALPAAQLLACQPHRLIAAACGVLAAAEHTERPHLAARLMGATVALAARLHASDHVLSWLTLPPQEPPQEPPLEQEGQMEAGAAGASGSTGGGAGPASAAASVRQPAPAARGCLVKPLKAIAPDLVALTPSLGGYILLLLKLAAEAQAQSRPLPNMAGPIGEGGDGGGGGSGGSSDRGSGATRDRFRSIAQIALNDFLAPDLLPQRDPRTDALLRQVLSEPVGPRGGAALPDGLPAPLALAASPAAALGRLRVCGNPACSNFARAAEDLLDLKRCAGCKVVRYCGAECQRAHWRGAHKGECPLLAGKQVPCAD